MAPRVGPTETNPTHHCLLTDQDGTEFGFVLVDGNGNPDPRAIVRNPIPRTSLKTSQGDTTYSDFEEPYIPVAQDSWLGGRGLLEFERDKSRFYDSYRVASWLDSGIVLGPREAWGTGYRLCEQNLPGSMTWVPITSGGIQDYYATKFTPSANITAVRVWAWIKFAASDAGTLRLSIYSDVGGNPDTELAYATVDPTDLEPNASLTTRSISQFWAFDLDAGEALTSGTGYWIVFHVTGSGGLPELWYVGADGTGVLSLKSADTVSWSSVTTGNLYYRVVAAETKRDWIYFDYKRAKYAVSKPAAGGAPNLYLNGYRGVATGTQSASTLKDTTQSWATNELAGAVALLSGGTGRDQYRTIASNTSDTITLDDDWDISPVTTDTEYVILAMDNWTEITGHGITKPVTDVLVSKDVIYFCQGQGTNVRRARFYNNSGTWTAGYDDDGSNKYDFMTIFTHSTAGVQIAGVVNDDTNEEVHIWRGDVQSWGTDITFGNMQVIGDNKERATGLDSYGDPAYPVVFKEGSVYFVIDDQVQPIPLREMENVRSEKNGRGHVVNQVYLYFSLLHSVQRYYRNNLDDVGPSRDAGLPDGRQGPVYKMLGYPGAIFWAVDAGDSGVSSVLVYRNGGIHELYRAPKAGMPIRELEFQVIPGSTPDRLWITVGNDLVWLAFPSDTTDPSKDSNMLFTHEGYLVTSWVYANLKDVAKFWDSLKLFLESGGISSGTLAYAWYQTDDDADADDWTPLTAYTSVPVEEVQIGSDAASVTGKRMRLRIGLQTPDVNKSPKLRAWLIQAVGRITPKFAYTLNWRAADENIDLEGDDDSYTRIETIISQLDTWAADPRPLTFKTVYSALTTVSKQVFIDPSSIRPNAIIFDDQIEQIIGNFVLTEA